MEMNFLRPVGQAEPAEPGPSYKEDQVWKDIENETGFASCADYMEFYKDIRPDFRDRIEQFRGLSEATVGTDLSDILPRQMLPEIAIYDLSKQNNPRGCLNFRKSCSSGTELVRALRDPPANSCRQLVLWTWESLRSRFFNQEMADALILGLRLDPRLLEDLDRLEKNQPYYHTDGFRTSHIKTFRRSGIIATLSENFTPKAVKAVPVLLVVARGIFGMTGFTGGDPENPPFNRSMRNRQNVTQTHLYANLYAKAVEEFIEQNRAATTTEAFLLLAAISPLLGIEACMIQRESNNLKAICDNKPHYGSGRELDSQRLLLRRTLEKGEHHVTQIFRYLDSEVHADWSKEPSYVSIKADWKALVEQAHRLETEVRDFMQIQVGNLSLAASRTSLEESRRSIELSNIQIRESQSVKIFTILAFVYVPLNLATSIFGMNIQQLNQNGQNIWVFFVTVIVALLVTGGSWILSNEIYKINKWCKARAVTNETNDKEDNPRDYDFQLRVAMLVWLVRNGHGAWMWTTGAWLAILINSKEKSKDAYYNLDVEVHPPTAIACDCVWDMSSSNQRMLETPYRGFRWSPISNFLIAFIRWKDWEHTWGRARRHVWERTWERAWKRAWKRGPYELPAEVS